MAFKVARMRESTMEDQDEFIMWKSDGRRQVRKPAIRRRWRTWAIMQTCTSPINRTIRKIRRVGAAQSFGYRLTVEFCRMLK